MIVHKEQPDRGAYGAVGRSDMMRGIGASGICRVAGRDVWLERACSCPRLSLRGMHYYEFGLITILILPVANSILTTC